MGGLHYQSMKNKKTYLVITPFFPHEKHFAGPYIYDQVRALMENSNYNVVVVKVLGIYNDQNIQSYEYQGILVNVFRTIDLPSSILPGLLYTLNTKRFEVFLRNKLNIDVRNIEIIHSHVTYPAGYLAVSFGKKYSIKNFIQHHGRDVFQLSNGRVLKGFLKKMNDAFILKRSLNIVNSTNLNIGVSKETLNQLQSNQGMINQNMYVLYNGVNTQKFHSLESQKENDRFVIGCIGNFWKTKDHMTLIKAVEKLTKEMSDKSIMVRFIGTGATRTECEDYVKSHHLENNFEFLDEVDHTELNIFYNTLDLFVLPSYDEALGCVYMEALQVGLPIIGVKGQGIEEIIHNEDKEHFLIQKQDVPDLANKILYFMQNKYLPSKAYDLDIELFIKDFLQKIVN